VKATREPRVGFAICDPGLSFGAIVGLGAKERAAELGVRLSIVSVFTPAEQAAVIQRFIREPVDVLIVEAVESRVVVPAILEAGAAGIPVIIADMGIHGAQIACTVRSDNVKGAELAAAYLIDRLQGQGTLAHLQGLLTSDNGVDRSRGLHNVVDRCPGIQIVETSSEWTKEAGAGAMSEILARHPCVEAVFANNDPLALGAIAAIDEAGRSGEIIVAGFDALPDALLAIEQGKLAATVRQMPRSMGHLALEVAMRVLDGERVPTVVETDVALVTAESVAEASLATLPLFPRILHDLTESSAALAEERSLLRALIDNLPDLIYVKDPTGRFVLVNQAGVRHLGGTTPEQVVGRTDADFFPAELAARYHADEQAVIQSGQPLINHEEPSTDATGTTRWFSTTKVLARDSSGAIVGLVGMNRDITERKQAEAEQARLAEELRQAQKLEAVGRLAGGIAHDFNNLLTAISGYSELLLERVHAEERADVEAIRQAAEQATALTKQLLAFSRRRALQPETLDLNEVVSQMDKLLRRLIGADVELVTVLDPALATVEADRSQLEQVIVNLALNARDAMPEGGKLVIETGNVSVLEGARNASRERAREGHVRLLARDSGAGIDSGTLERIFEPFFTTKGAGRGTGLGLSTVQSIIDQAGGRISVQSRPGQGTTFEIILPASGEPRSARDAGATDVGSLDGSETILVVEDDEILRTLAVRTLREHGYDVLEARYASEALETWTERRADVSVVVSDVVMPGMSGVELADRIASTNADVKIILMSGFADPAAAQHLPTHTIGGFLEKPFTPRTLLRAVREAIETAPQQQHDRLSHG
jgi:PAS domain S-box-containing protein